MGDGQSVSDMEQLVNNLYDVANVSEDARQETQVDESAEVAYIPLDALSEIAETVDSLSPEEARSERGEQT
jgi:hypothetical protein